MTVTAAFRERWRSYQLRQPVALVAIGPLSPSGTTIRAATRACVTPDGVVWGPLLGRNGSISSTSQLLGTDVPMARATFTIFDVEATFTAAGEKISGLLAGNQVIGAPVTIWLWDMNLSDSADVFQRFVGVVQTYSTAAGTISFTCLQRRDWNRSVIVKRVAYAEFPDAPEDSIGLPIPTLIGKLGGLPMREPFDAEYSDLQHWREHFAGGARVVKAVLVDSGRGGGGTNPPAKVLVASHRVSRLGVASPNYGTAVFLEGSDGVAHVIDPASGDLFIDDAGSGFLVPDGSGTAFYPVFPCDLYLTTEYADNPRAILDRKGETRYARLDYSASKRNLYAKLPSVPPESGEFVHAYAFIIYRSSATLSGCQFLVVNGALSTYVTLTPSANEAYASIDLGTGGWGTGELPTSPWDFSEVMLRVGWTLGTPVGTLEVVAMGISVEYRPSQDLIRMEKRTELRPIQRTPRQFPGPGRDRPTIYVTHAQREVSTEIRELRGKFYANVFGYPDDASGSYTGTANAVIERPCDVARLLLSVFGGESGFAGSGALGGFADARALLRTWNLRDMVLAMSIAETLDVNAALGMVMAASASLVYLSEFTDLWRFLPFRVAPAVTYPDPIVLADILDPASGVEVDLTPDSDVLTGLRIGYSRDQLSDGLIHEVSATVGGSSSGHLYRNLRDGLLTVADDVNDKIDFSAFASTKVATLTPGTYDPWSLAKMVKAQLDLAEPLYDWAVCYGCRIEAGVNDTLKFEEVSGTVIETTVAEGDYESFEALCAAVQTAFNAAGAGGWSVTFDRSTRKATISRTSWGRTFPVGSRADVYTVLGFLPVATVCPVTSAVAVEEKRFTIANAPGFTLYWRTGTNGLLGTKQSAAELLGFDWQDDLVISSLATIAVAVSPKFEVENDLTAAATAFGQKRDLILDGSAIYDTPTALELRNRLVALLRKPRALVRFSSERLADIERGDVFECDDSIDAIQAFPGPETDGSWAGKRFLVLETHQRFGDSWHTEVVAIDLTD